MFRVNFLPWRARAQWRRYRFWRGVFTGQGVLALVAGIALFAFLHQQQVQQGKVLAQLAQHKSELGQRYQQVQLAMSRLAQQAARAAQLARNGEQNRRYLQLLQHCSTLAPAPLWLVALEGNPQGLVLRGMSHRYLPIAQFGHELAALSSLQQQRLEEVVQRDDGALSFTLKAQWRGNG